MEENATPLLDSLEAHARLPSPPLPVEQVVATGTGTGEEEPRSRSTMQHPSPGRLKTPPSGRNSRSPLAQRRSAKEIMEAAHQETAERAQLNAVRIAFQKSLAKLGNNDTRDIVSRGEGMGGNKR